jgi:hypothetical protein
LLIPSPNRLARLIRDQSWREMIDVTKNIGAAALTSVPE